MAVIRHHALPDGRRIAFRFAGPAGRGRAGGCGGGGGTGPAVVFLPGYRSDMAGEKAQAVFAQALAERRACLLLDYSGCGASSGDFADGTLSRWREEALALIEAHCPGEVVLVGSSMGGWLMLLVAAALRARAAGPHVVGMVGIAAAPDFTDWGIGADDAARLEAGETLYAPSLYSDEPTPTHPGFYADAQALRVLDAPIAFDGPVRLLHGQADGDVPWPVVLRLAEALRSDDVRVVLIKDGDHRLSRGQDIALLLATIAELVASPDTAREPVSEAL